MRVNEIVGSIGSCIGDGEALNRKGRRAIGSVFLTNRRRGISRIAGCHQTTAKNRNDNKILQGIYLRDYSRKLPEPKSKLKLNVLSLENYLVFSVEVS
jgi:hypothetical protein